MDADREPVSEHAWIGWLGWAAIAVLVGWPVLTALGLIG